MSLHVCVIAGEASGDFLGARLMEAITQMKGDVTFSGVGGPLMTRAGLNSLFSYDELSVMGVAEILPKLPQLLGRIRQTAMHIVTNKPDIVVTIDSPDFCFRVIKAVRKNMMDGPKFIHYVAPTVWAWREGRAEKISKFLDGLICLFDFEPPYFEKYGLKSIAVGHPMIEGAAMMADGARFRDECGILQSEKTIGILFGSRRGEIKRTGKVLRDAAYTVAQRMNGNVHIIAPTLPHVKDSVYQLLKDSPYPIHITDAPDEKYDAFKAMDIALAVSGTVGLELAALQIPHVIAYMAAPITAAILKRVVKVKYAHLANIMAGREIVPEFIQERCVAEDIAQQAFEIYEKPQSQKADLSGIAQRLGAHKTKTPSQKAAGFVLEFLQSSRA